jgi:hypothetical protein
MKIKIIIKKNQFNECSEIFPLISNPVTDSFDKASLCISAPS